MNFFKLYIGDYQRDTGTLSLAEHGAYMLMLQHLYATEAPLPKGRELYRLLRAETPAERAAIEAVARKFWRDTENGLVNDRALRELELRTHQRDVNREVGKRGGRPKKPKEEPNGNRIGFESETNQEPINNPNQTPDTREKQKHPPNPPEGGGEVALPAWLPSRDWQAFVAHRQALRKPLTAEAQRRCIAKLGRLRAAGQDPAALLDEAISNGWQGIFPARGNGAAPAAAPLRVVV